MQLDDKILEQNVCFRRERNRGMVPLLRYLNTQFDVVIEHMNITNLTFPTSR